MTADRNATEGVFEWVLTNKTGKVKRCRAYEARHSTATNLAGLAGSAPPYSITNLVLVRQNPSETAAGSSTRKMDAIESGSKAVQARVLVYLTGPEDD
jgi:hypothetical protein